MSAETFAVVTSKATPLLIDNIDTDVITPIGRVLEGRDAVVKYAFEPMRFTRDGALDPACPLNDPAFAGAQILIGGDNFGCGSSRETAVWAVRGLGYRVVIAKSFGDIFFSNCFKNGVLAVQLPAEQVDRLAEAAARGETVSVDLQSQRITSGDSEAAFAVSSLRKEMLASGLDDLGLISRRAEAISEFERADKIARPWVYQLAE